MAPKQALVFGASGISGWAIVRECLSYPSSKEFLLSDEETTRLETYSGIDLTAGFEEVVDRVKQIPALDEITHVYYTAYAGHGADFQTLKALNVTLFNNALRVITNLCLRLEFIVLQTGGKTYGMEFHGQPGLTFSPPLQEFAPRINEPYASNIFY